MQECVPGAWMGRLDDRSWLCGLHSTDWSKRLAFLGFDVAVCTAQVIRALARSPRERLTLDRLRSDLSHETAAKIARLSGIVEEWRHGRFQAGDAAATREILRDLQRVYLRHPRPACARFGTLARLVRLLRVLRMAQRQLAALRPPIAPSPEIVARYGLWVALLASESKALVEALSRRYGTRLVELVENAVGEISREAAGGNAEPVVRLEAADNGTGVWVPRADAAAWSDVLRNLIRNGVEATAEKLPSSSAPVSVRVLPLSGRVGTAVEILDDGIGMSPAEVARMWGEGNSRHGAHRGRGLTEAKRVFVERRATLELRSARGVGTCLRIEVPHHDLPFRAEPLWVLPPVVLSVATVLGLVLVASFVLLRSPVVAVRVDDQRIVQAVGADGSTQWTRRLSDTVLINWGSDCGPRGPVPAPILPHLVVPRAWPRNSAVILATMPAAGSGSVLCLGARGRTEWVHALSVSALAGDEHVALACMSECLAPWGRKQTAIALNVRDRNFSSTAVQFVTLEGKLLGAYYHPGHLQFHSVADLDGDGQSEMLLNGMNNDARRDSTYLAADPGEGFYADCLVILKPQEVSGQAYPGTRWPEMPRAKEDAYLVFPPLEAGRRPKIGFVTVGNPDGRGFSTIEVALHDGRFYTLDGRLRPIDCTAGDNTDAAKEAGTTVQAPFVYFRSGIRESIRIPIRR